jgi:hypothetical protein
VIREFGSKAAKTKAKKLFYYYHRRGTAVAGCSNDE